MRCAAVATTRHLPRSRCSNTHLISVTPQTVATAARRTDYSKSSSPYRSASTAIVRDAIPPSNPTVYDDTTRSVQEHIDLLSRDVGGEQYWTDRLREVSLDLGTRSPRVSIYGDPLASPEDVVSSLLQTPFSDESTISTFISDRKSVQGGSDIMKFEFQSNTVRDANRLGLPSGWLRQSGADLFEITGSKPLPHLLRSDVAVIVVDPFRLLDVDSIRNLPIPLLEESTIIVNGYLPTHETAESISARLRKSLGPGFNGDIIFSNARLAIEAYSRLHSGGGSPSPEQVTSFQELFLASGIGLAQQRLANSAKDARRRSPSEIVLHLANQYARNAVASDTERAQRLLRTVRELRTAAQSAAHRAHNLSVASRQIDGGRIQGSIESSRLESAARIEALFQHRLGWLSLLFGLRIDDLAGELEREAARAYTDVEQQLTYEAGQLYQLQQYLSVKADKVIRKTEPPFNSAVLANRLSTLSLSIPAVEAGTLVEPIQRRRSQLVTEIIPLLHTKARWILSQSYMGAAGGIAAAWAAYVPPLELVSAGTAAGLAILSVVASLWTGQARWLRSQRAFWRSWDRCNHMLTSDVKVAFTSAVDNFVVAKPYAAAEGLEQLVQKRLTALSRLEERVTTLAPREV